MNNNILLAIIISSLVSALILILIQKKKILISNRKIIKAFNIIYNFLVKKRIAPSLESIRIRIYNNTFGEDWLIKYKTVLYWLISWVLGIASMVFVILYFQNNIYITLTFLLFCFEIKSLILNLLIGDDTNFLVGIYNYSTELQQAYSLEKDISKAIQEANNNSTNVNLIQRMDYIDKIIDDQEAINEYIQECPNEYLKLIAINCNLINENGDKKDVDGKSVFLENLFYTNALIETEVFKRRRLQFWLRGLAPLTIAPLLAFTPYEMWVSSTLPITDVFYQAKLGFITKLVITIIAIIIFYIIKSFEKASKKRNLNEKTRFWEDNFFKVPLIKKFIFKIKPSNRSAKGYRYKKLISESGEYTKIEYIYLRKILFAIIGFTLTLSVCFYINNISKDSIINNNTTKYAKTLVVTNDGQVDSTEIEKEVMKEVDINDLDGSYIKVREKLEEYGIVSNIDNVSQKILQKQIDISNQHIKVYHILLALAVMLLGYNAPEISLKLKMNFRKYEMQNEVIIFETIILIFMYHESATSELILENMAKFADIFKPQIDEVLKEVKRSDVDTLKLLAEEIKYRPFLNIIKNLIKAENLKTRDAFISLADNRRNYIATRKEDNKEVIYKNVSKSRTLSLIPASLLITLYITVPMFYVSFTQLNATQDTMNSVEQSYEEEEISNDSTDDLNK